MDNKFTITVVNNPIKENMNCIVYMCSVVQRENVGENVAGNIPLLFVSIGF